MTASIRRAPEPTEPSERITNGPISAVERTCVPPQSSRETPSTSTTRTSSPYFSPKSIIAPRFRASSIGTMNVRTGWFSKTASLTRRSTSARSSAVERLRVREVEAELVRPHRRARLVDVVAEHLAQRLVQEVRRGVVRHRREADRPRHDRLHAVACREALALEEQHLVVADPVARRAASRARAVLLELARVGHLAAALGVERRLAELREKRPVAELLQRADLRQHLGLLPADELGDEAGLAREVGRLLELALAAAGARDLAVALHLPRVLVLVDGDARARARARR